jgi:hypothetical protein
MKPGSGPQPAAAKTRTPPPAAGRIGQLPSRASFQLPQTPDADDGAAEPPPAPVEPSPARASVFGRGAMGWADEEPAAKKPANAIGPVGLVAFALLLMVAVYFGATLLMKP